MKTIIAAWGSKERGKSQGIKAAALSFQFTSYIHPWHKNEEGEYSYDSYVIGRYTTSAGRDTTVGMENQGDPNSNQSAWIQHCLDAECEVMVCACRTSGETRNHVRDVASDYGYELIDVTTPFHYWGKTLPNGLDLTIPFAEHLNKLIDACLE